MGNDIRVCKRCKGIFRHSGEQLCPKCVAELDEIYLTIREYLDVHPRASVKEIIENTEVDEKTILTMLRDGRFQLTAADGSLLCDKCGKPITSGRTCEDCRIKLEKILSEAAASMKPKEDEKPRHLGDQRSRGMHINVIE